ncbi:MAG: uL15m family ribosomal protein, partial [bacterium]
SFKYLKTDKVDMDVLVEAGFVSGKRDCLKIIGKADLDKAYTVRADKFSEGAAESITKAGGKAEEIKLD